MLAVAHSGQLHPIHKMEMRDGLVLTRPAEKGKAFEGVLIITAEFASQKQQRCF